MTETKYITCRYKGTFFYVFVLISKLCTHQNQRYFNISERFKKIPALNKTVIITIIIYFRNKQKH